MKQRQNSKDDGGGSSPAFVIHQTPADQNAAGGNQQEYGTEREEHVRHECVGEHFIVHHQTREVTEEHESARGNQPKRADDDPQNAYSTKVALETRPVRRGIGSDWSLPYWIAAFWAKVELGLKLSTAVIAEHGCS